MYYAGDEIYIKCTTYPSVCVKTESILVALNWDPDRDEEYPKNENSVIKYAPLFYMVFVKTYLFLFH